MSSVFYRSPRQRYPVAVKSSGIWIEDANGKKYLDASGGAAVSCIGHNHPHIIDAVKTQLDKLAYAHTSFFTNEPQERLAEQLASRFLESDAKVYFLSSGSEANETAVKMAWQYWQARGEASKKIIISRDHSYHGNTYATLSISGNPARRANSAAPLINWPRIMPCYPYRYQQHGENDVTFTERAANELKHAIESVGVENVAAFICEPIAGASLGVIPATEGYLRKIRAICDQYNILFIADEVMCGSGRSGTYFAHEYDNIVPDIVTLAKGIGGGYLPLAATIARSNIASTLEEQGFAHGHTYIGHPLACAAGLATQHVLKTQNLLAKTLEMGQKLKRALYERFSSHAHIGDIRGRGLFLGLEIVADRDTKAGFSNGSLIPQMLKSRAMEEGLICYPGGITVENKMVPHVLLAPPMTINDQDIDAITDKLEISINQVLEKQ